MSTQTPDRFEDRLLAAMIEDFDSLTAPPAARPRLARPLRRRLAWTGGVAAAAALAALAVAITGGGSAGTASGPSVGAAGKSAGAPSGTPAHFENADYVVRQVERATGEGSDGLIEYVSSHAPDSETGEPTWTESWTSPGAPTSRIETLDAQGKPLSASILTTGTAANESILIDYADRTWAKLISPNQPGEASAAAPATSAASEGNWQTELRQELARGEFEIAGRETLDGREAIELEATDPYPGGLLRLWVDAETFRPIREIGAAPGVDANGPQVIRNEFRWLPATAANLALIDPEEAVPTGFQEVSPATEEGLEAGD
jgi:hypothetical protein